MILNISAVNKCHLDSMAVIGCVEISHKPFNHIEKVFCSSGDTKLLIFTGNDNNFKQETHVYQNQYLLNEGKVYFIILQDIENIQHSLAMLAETCTIKVNYPNKPH